MHATFLEIAPTTLSYSYTRLRPNDFRLKSVEMSLAAVFLAFRNAWWGSAVLDIPGRCSFGASVSVQTLCEPSRSDPSTLLNDDRLNLAAKKIRQLRRDLYANILET